MSQFDLGSYQYDLPPERIAQEATHPQHDARLIVGSRGSANIGYEGIFMDLPQILGTDRVLFFNDSRVLPARIPLKSNNIIRRDGTYGSIANGEILFCQNLPGGDFEALVRPGNKFKIGTKILFDEGCIEVKGLTHAGRILATTDISIESLMRKYGELPLPPYIEYSKEKEIDYQSAFAKNEGSVAAPTASLHFTNTLLDRIENPKEYITLHVGIGTFKGIDVADIRDYQIHRETVEIELNLFERIASYKKHGQRLVAVGTTVCRTLESLPSLWCSLHGDIKHGLGKDTQKYWNTLTENMRENDWIHAPMSHDPGSMIHFETSIYITPGYEFQIVDELITNFHLPESSLLVLVSAFMGKEHVDRLYQHAIREKYRFFSFGDGMYIRERGSP